MDSANIVLFGNCQLHPVYKNILANIDNLKSDLKIYISPPCHVIQEDKVSDLHQYVKNADYLILSFIFPGYRNNLGLDTQTLTSLIKSDCKIFLVPSIYFNSYFPELFYFCDKQNNKLTADYDYHNLIILKSYSNKYTQSECADFFYNYKYSLDTSIAEISINNLIKHENKIISFIESQKYQKNISSINLSSIIANEFMTKRIFWSFNHPTSYLLNYVSDYICKQIFNENNLIHDILELNNNFFPITRAVYERYNLKFENKQLFRLKNIDMQLDQVINSYYKFYDLHKDEIDINLEKLKRNNLGLTLL